MHHLHTQQRRQLVTEYVAFSDNFRDVPMIEKKESRADVTPSFKNAQFFAYILSPEYANIFQLFQTGIKKLKTFPPTLVQSHQWYMGRIHPSINYKIYQKKKANKLIL